VKIFVPAASTFWAWSSAAIAASGAAVAQQPLLPMPWVLMGSAFLVATIAQFSRAQSSDRAPKLRVAIFSSIASGIVGAGGSILIDNAAARIGWWDLADGAVIGLAGILGFIGGDRVAKLAEKRFSAVGQEVTANADRTA
jgi:hypothetical protein